MAPLTPAPKTRPEPKNRSEPKTVPRPSRSVADAMDVEEIPDDERPALARPSTSNAALLSQAEALTREVTALKAEMSRSSGVCRAIWSESDVEVWHRFSGRKYSAKKAIISARTHFPYI